MFRKKAPDPHRFMPLTEELYDKYNGVEKSPLMLLVLSRIKAGVAFEDRVVKTHTGRGVPLARGQTWCSTKSIREDINYATGNSYTYRQVRYAAQKLEDAEFTSEPVLGGKYGRKFTISDELMKKGNVDILQQYRILYYGDTDKFFRGKIVTGDYEDQKRGKWGDTTKWIQYVSENGIDKPAFTSVGRWRPGGEGARNSPVFVPFIYIDIDRQNLVAAHEDTMRIVEDLMDAQFDMERCFVSFSGGKGFHIAISTDQVGSPIFHDTEAARETIKNFFRRVTDEKVDHSTASPLGLIRVPGSRHENGNYKRTWTAQRFMNIGKEVVFASPKEFEAFTFPDPTQGEVEENLRKAFEDTAIEVKDQIVQARSKSDARSRKQGPTITRILEGVGESEFWGDGYCGRNWALYILSCWVLEDADQAAGVAESLGMNVKFQPGEKQYAKEVVEYWNQRNNPPIDQRELDKTFKSAERKVR